MEAVHPPLRLWVAILRSGGRKHAEVRCILQQRPAIKIIAEPYEALIIAQGVSPPRHDIGHPSVLGEQTRPQRHIRALEEIWQLLHVGAGIGVAHREARGLKEIALPGNTAVQPPHRVLQQPQTVWGLILIGDRQPAHHDIGDLVEVVPIKVFARVDFLRQIDRPAPLQRPTGHLFAGSIIEHIVQPVIGATHRLHVWPCIAIPPVDCNL